MLAKGGKLICFGVNLGTNFTACLLSASKNSEMYCHFTSFPRISKLCFIKLFLTDLSKFRGSNMKKMFCPSISAISTWSLCCDTEHSEHLHVSSPLVTNHTNYCQTYTLQFDNYFTHQFLQLYRGCSVARKKIRKRLFPWRFKTSHHQY